MGDHAPAHGRGARVACQCAAGESGVAHDHTKLGGGGNGGPPSVGNDGGGGPLGKAVYAGGGGGGAQTPGMAFGEDAW